MRALSCGISAKGLIKPLPFSHGNEMNKIFQKHILVTAAQSWRCARKIIFKNAAEIIIMLWLLGKCYCD